MIKFIILLTAIAGIFCISANAQTPCEPNMDFSLGNYSNWVYYVGTCCTGTGVSSFPILTTTPPAAAYIPCEFALTGTAAGGSVAVTGIDPFGGFPVVGTGSYSLRIGCNRTDGWAEKAEYYVHVPTGSTNYSIIYHYALVLEYPSSHPVSDMPKFDVTATDSATGTILPCVNFNYATGTLPGFVGPVSNAYAAIPSYGCPGQAAAAINGWTADVYYKPWDTTVINLSGYGGHTIIMSFSASDDAAGTHFAYGYIDMSCGTFAISVAAGCGASSATLTAPAGYAGYASYSWYDSATFTTMYGTTGTLSVPVTSSPAYYALVLTPYTGFGCPDTLYTTVFPNCSGTPLPGVITTTTTAACATSLFTLTDSIYYYSGMYYQWQSSPDSLTWSDITGATTTTYTSSGITATTYYRCKDSCCASGLTAVTAGLKITYLSPGSITGSNDVCVGSTISLSNTVAGGTWSSSNGNATIGSVSGIVTGISSATPSPTITYKLFTGCAATTTITVNPISPITGSANICASGGTVTLHDGTAGGTWSGTGALVNSTTGDVTGVAAGTATITYTTSAGCTATTSLTVTPIPGPINGGAAVCVGATISLSDTTAGGVWSCSPSSVATISGTGVVYGLSGGTVVITYTIAACNATASVTVNGPQAPQICVVDLDSASGKNLVVWEQFTPNRVEWFNVYRETPSSVFVKIDSQAQNIFSTYLDTGSYPALQSYSYQLTATDSCGNESPLGSSTIHTTVHLSANLGVGGVVNLIWNTYIGEPVTTQEVMRSAAGAPYVDIASVANTVTSYTDATPPSGTLMYQINSVMASGCTPSARTTSAYSIVSSNPIEISSTGIPTLASDPGVQIYPNPAHNSLTITSTDNITNVVISNIVGQTVYTYECNTQQVQVSVADLPPGVYFVKVNGADVRKFVKQ